MNPVFFAWTRSFWLGVVAVVSVAGSDAALMDGLSQILALVLGQPFEVVDTVVDRLLPAVATIAALQQRSGSARPYTVRMDAVTLS